jgi:membrane fusion protein, multidrug efflux system
MHLAIVFIRLLIVGAISIAAIVPTRAQPAPSGPPAVGAVEATKRPITESSEFLGRVEAVNRVSVVARDTAFLEKRLFEEGAEVKQGDELYRLERGPFEADLAAKKAQVAQLEATLENARLTADRARILLSGPAGQQSSYDAAIANQRSLEAQVQAAQAQVQASQINLDYTDVRSPIDGRIGRTAVTEGNVVGPSSGALTTIVSQDPMYVIFPVPVRQGLELRARYSPQGGLGAVVMRLRLPDGRVYDQTGKLDFVDVTVSQSTDTVTVRGVIHNSVLENPSPTGGPVRELTDGEFVTVLMEGVQPVEVVAIPRAAVLSDQQGDYVFVVGPANKAEQRRIQLGQSTPVMGSVISGLSPGEKVIVEGLQRVRAGQPVSPGPASPQILATMKAASDDRPQSDGEAASQIKPAGNSK